MSPLKPVFVCTANEGLAALDFFRVFESFFPIKASLSRAEAPPGFGTRQKTSGQLTCFTVPNLSSLTVQEREHVTANGTPFELEVDFADVPDVPFPFRGRTVRSKVAFEPKPLFQDGHQRVLAKNRSGPLWTVSEKDGIKCYQSGFALPTLRANGSLNEVVNGENYLEILPLIQWLREICADGEYKGPPIRASFMFDDPNLHWPNYGYVDFREIAAHAAKTTYHVSFATVPLDTWFTHEGTAEIFRKHSGHLSLTIHGNSHVKRELALEYLPSERSQLLTQAIRRIDRLERKTGLHVCRVMVPPHGACSESMLAELPKCGFEAACISHGSLRAHNPGKLWTRSLGYMAAEVIRGCPVLPRWGLTGRLENTILVAAFLNQAIVLRGHHQDLKDGIEVLDRLAEFINQLGHVSWLNMTELSRMNFQWRMQASVCRLKPLGRRVVFPVPDQATQLVIDSLPDWSSHSWRVSCGNGVEQLTRSGEAVSLPDQKNRVISVVAAPVPSVVSADSRLRPALGPFVRRVLTETRDRLFGSRLLA